jgi:ribosome-associated protein
MGKISVTSDLAIDASEISEEFIHASGPGGQNVNKVSTAVQIRFNCAGSPSLNASIRERLKKIAGRRLNSEGTIVLRAQRFRTRELNRRDAVNRLIELIRQASIAPSRRKRTRRTAASNERRLEEKKQRGARKIERNLNVEEY